MAGTLVAVTNTGPIIALCGAGRLQLLDELFERLVVPFAVMLDLLGKPGAPEAAQLVALKAFELRSLNRAPPAETSSLDEGERAAVALTLELGGDVALLDEVDARRVASSLGLEVKGSLGVLVEAKRRGLLPAVEPAVREMIGNGCWFAPRLVERVLRSVGER